jgi:hypothetical protein
LPQLEGLESVEDEANLIFCGFDNIVHAKGRIECVKNGLIEISCSDNSGMSGSPIISQEKVVGVYVEGPLIPGQRECVKILQRLWKQENPLEIMQDIRNLILFDSYFADAIFYQFVENFDLIGRSLAGVKLKKKLCELKRCELRLIELLRNCQVLSMK